MILHIDVLDKQATYQVRDGHIICGNSDYQVKFNFDPAWDDHAQKTARFEWNGRYVDVEFTGDTCEVPVVDNTKNLFVGVYVGEEPEDELILSTSRCMIPCIRSVRCGNAAAGEGFGEDYTNQAKGYAAEAKASAEEAQNLVDGFDRDLTEIDKHVKASEDTLKKLNAECERSVGTDGKVYCILERNPYEETAMAGDVTTQRMYGITEMIMSGYVNWHETDGTARSSYFETNITRQVQGIKTGYASTFIVSGVVCAKRPDGFPSEPKLYAIKVSVANACFGKNDVEGLQHPDNYGYSECLGAFAMNFNGAWVYDHEKGWTEAEASSIKVRTIMPRILDQK